MNGCRLWFKRRPLLLPTTHFNLSLMFSFPPPFYFLAEELILIVALQQGSLHGREQLPVCLLRCRTSEAVRLGAVHCSGHILIAPLSYKAWIVFHVILVNLAAGKGIGFPCELLIRLPQRGEIYSCLRRRPRSNFPDTTAGPRTGSIQPPPEWRQGIVADRDHYTAEKGLFGEIRSDCLQNTQTVFFPSLQNYCQG